MRRAAAMTGMVVLVVLALAATAGASTAAVPAWARHGAPAVGALRRDAGSLPEHVPATGSGGRRACARVEAVAARLEALPPLPRARLERRWAGALHHVARASDACRHTFRAGSRAAEQRALVEVRRAARAVLATWAAVRTWAASAGGPTTTTTSTSTSTSTTTTTTTTTTTVPPPPPTTVPTTPPPTAPPPTAPPPTTAPAAPAGCSPIDDEGGCYEPGEYCRDATHGVSGTAGDGEPIVCETNDGWRWEPTS